MKERLATLISGSGTTMQEIIRACQSGEIPMDFACVISSNPLAGGIEKAKKLQIPEENLIIIDPNKFRGADKKIDQEGFGNTILKELRERGVTVVTQNGWLPLTPEHIIEEYRETIFNQHPGPLPETEGMCGRQAHAVILYFRRDTKGEPWTEVVVQRVDKRLDMGAIVKSRRVKILPTDTVDDLQKRALPIEHRLQIELLRDLASGNVKEVPKRESLVKPGEEQALFIARKIGRLLYPNG